MSVQVLYKKKETNKSVKNFVYFINPKKKLSKLNYFISKNDVSFISSVLKKNHSNKKILSFDLNQNQKVILILINEKLNLSEIENLGADFYNFVKLNVINNFTLFTESIGTFFSKSNEIFCNFIHGFELKSYEFNKYKSKTKSYKILATIIESKEIKKSKVNSKYKALLLGTTLARDLVSEPPNVLYPKEYVKRVSELKKIGLKVTAYNEKELKKLGLNSLLGVGQGSIKESFLVTLEWNGNKKSKEKPLSFVGKGVCFDTGGISLKPAKFMEEMKYDMAGSAVVVGLMKTLAMRKAKVNAVGVIGLVENMPGGNAQRPGDIVKSFSGKTIEVLNTDAEGRLVLADALTFTEKKFQPKCIIDLATLTGAIIISLGEEYAGLFSNDDDLSKKIFNAGEEVGEKVWRMPLNKNYDKLINSSVADVQNINYSGGAGSITAAQFLQRFITNGTPWAHLDIAGMAFAKKAANLNPSGATGFGVRLLNKFIEENYE